MLLLLLLLLLMMMMLRLMLLRVQAACTLWSQRDARDAWCLSLFSRAFFEHAQARVVRSCAA